MVADTRTGVAEDREYGRTGVNGCVAGRRGGVLGLHRPVSDTAAMDCRPDQPNSRQRDPLGL